MKLVATMKAFGGILYKNRATIATVTGMLCVVGGTAVVISKAREATAVAEDLEVENAIIARKDANDEWESKKERSIARRGLCKYAVKEYTRVYWLGILIILVGLGLITWSDIEQCKTISQMSALAAAYATTLSAVRERVIADQGEEKWEEYLLGPQFTTVDVMPDGTIIQTTEPIDNPNRSANLPPHCFFFDEANINWEKDPIHNRDFLETHERWLNQKLQTEGFLFENDIRRDLNMPLVKTGWTAGIMADIKDPVTGQMITNYLKLGLDAKNPAAQAFRDGTNPSILLMPNVEDNILEQLRLPLI